MTFRKWSFKFEGFSFTGLFPVGGYPINSNRINGQLVFGNVQAKKIFVVLIGYGREAFVQKYVQDIDTNPQVNSEDKSS